MSRTPITRLPVFRLGFIAALSAAWLVLASSAFAAAFVVVNGAWTGFGNGTIVMVGPNSYTIGTDAFATIQDGVNAVDPGGTVSVQPGTYEEQVVANGKNLTIDGSGRASTTIKSPVTLTTFFTTSANNYAIVLCENATDIRVEDLTIDGAGRGNGNYRFIGIAFWDAGGKLLNSDVKSVRETPFNGVQHGIAVYAFNDNSGPYALEVGSCNLTDFQKNGTALNGDGLTANVHDCTVTGQGPTSLTAENGVQIAFGAGGSVTNCTISGCWYTGGSDVGIGALLYSGGPATVSGGSVSGCQVPVYYQDVSGSVNGVNIAPGSAAGLAPVGVELFNDLSSAPQSRVAPTAVGGGRRALIARPVFETRAARGIAPASILSAPMVVNVTGGCMTGTGAANSEGIDVFSSGAPIQSTITGVEISNFDLGIGTGGSGGVTVDANHNSITGNVTAGYDFYGPGSASNSATPNWWGNAGGPGVGGANPVLGAGVVSSPWLVSGTDLNPGCGFAAPPDNQVTAGPAPSCISSSNTCITIPVNITRTTSDNVRGFSVTLQLSANLQLCAGNSSITEGTYLSGVGATNFQVLNNGGGNYTVDCAILGTPCGATAATGNLFNLAVKRNGSDGTGTITLGTVLLRDCSNAPVAASAGPALNITIDTVAPTAIANLAAAQVKTGNGGSGRTGVTVTFTAPGDAATTEVYRAPFGHYPDYDDLGGATPATPAYPPPAPWTLTGVTASGQQDHPPVRDFWYYVVFTKDACGNVSAVSNQTSGTLDYHLGDVSDGITACAGNNQVTTADISLIGANYGATISVGGALECLDVGPTTTTTVDGRPTTDHKVQFEDLILFAINYGQVSAPQMAATPAVDADEVVVDGPANVTAGQSFTVTLRMKGSGAIQGLSAMLGWDRTIAEPVAVSAGDWVTAQNGVVFSSEPGDVDAALLGVRSQGITGEGVLATVTFRALASGKPGVTLAKLDARDATNRPIALTRGTEAPKETVLMPAAPNPFRNTAALGFAIAKAGPVDLSVYSVDGRRVRDLVRDTREPGVYRLSWDGRDNSGQVARAGLYFVRLQTQQGRFTRTLVLVK